MVAGRGEVLHDFGSGHPSVDAKLVGGEIVRTWRDSFQSSSSRSFRSAAFAISISSINLGSLPRCGANAIWIVSSLELVNRSSSRATRAFVRLMANSRSRLHPVEQKFRGRPLPVAVMDAPHDLQTRVAVCFFRTRFDGARLVGFWSCFISPPLHFSTYTPPANYAFENTRPHRRSHSESRRD